MFYNLILCTAALSALISSVSSSSYTPTRLDVKRPLLKRQKNIVMTGFIKFIAQHVRAVTLIPPQFWHHELI